MTILHIDSAALNQLLNQPGELAVLDLRSAQQFGKWGAPLNASNLPFERLERDIVRAVPRRDTAVVLVDGGDGVAERGARLLLDLGYTAVRVLKGGIDAWVASGFATTFSVTGNDYADQILRAEGTPSITAQQLADLRRDGRDSIVLDTRSLEEYSESHVPGAVSVPGAELLQRYLDLVPAAETLVVVSCALLARAILGAQTLIDAGVGNPVVFLYDGTKGWRDAGFELEHGPTRVFGPYSADAGDFAQRKTRRLQNPEIGQVDAGRIAQWREDDARTTYLVDVRTSDEYARDHLPGALSAPGGQLILGTFRFLAVRGARLVLIDDTGVRAATTAHWLRRRGWEVHLHQSEPAWQVAA